jgi:hypothetical protein
MSTKRTLLLSAVLGFSVGAVAADNAVVLSDAQMDGATAGSGFTSSTFIQKVFLIDEHIFDTKNADYKVNTNVHGFSAVGQAESDAKGPNADSQTFTFTQIDPSSCGCMYHVSSASKSIALVTP